MNTINKRKYNVSGFKAAFQWVKHSRLEFVEDYSFFLIKMENRTTYIQLILLDINRKSTFLSQCSIRHTKDQNRKGKIKLLF